MNLSGKGEYGRGPIHTNTIEGYFSIFKRGMKGVTSIASICTDIWLSTISGTAIVRPLASKMKIAPNAPFVVSSGGG